MITNEIFNDQVFVTDPTMQTGGSFDYGRISFVEQWRQSILRNQTYKGQTHCQDTHFIESGKPQVNAVPTCQIYKYLYACIYIYTHTYIYNYNIYIDILYWMKYH